MIIKMLQFMRMRRLRREAGCLLQNYDDDDDNDGDDDDVTVHEDEEDKKQAVC